MPNTVKSSIGLAGTILVATFSLRVLIEGGYNYFCLQSFLLIRVENRIFLKKIATFCLKIATFLIKWWWRPQTSALRPKYWGGPATPMTTRLAAGHIRGRVLFFRFFFRTQFLRVLIEGGFYSRCASY